MLGCLSSLGMRSIGPAVRLEFEAFRFSLVVLVLKSTLVHVSSLKFDDSLGACRLSFEQATEAKLSWSVTLLVCVRHVLVFLEVVTKIYS